jgi:hypothetical protein
MAGRDAVRARGFVLASAFPALHAATQSSNGSKRIWFAKRGNMLAGTSH